MLLFGMMNWTFTWLQPQGRLTHADVAPLIADLLLGGIGGIAALQAQPATPSIDRAAARGRERRPPAGRPDNDVQPHRTRDPSHQEQP